MSDGIGETDLFGAPVPHRRTLMGRPRHEPTRPMRRNVRTLREAGLTQLEIADWIGISVPTLWAHYFEELGRSPPPYWYRLHAREQEVDNEGP